MWADKLCKVLSCVVLWVGLRVVYDVSGLCLFVCFHVVCMLSVVHLGFCVVAVALRAPVCGVVHCSHGRWDSYAEGGWKFVVVDVLYVACGVGARVVEHGALPEHVGAVVLWTSAVWACTVVFDAYEVEELAGPKASSNDAS